MIQSRLMKLWSAELDVSIKQLWAKINFFSLTLSRPVTPNGVIVFEQRDRVKGVSKFTNKVNTNEELLISDV
jgi:hypothetical protein